MRNDEGGHGFPGRRGLILLGWVLLLGTVLVWSALHERRKLLSEFGNEAAILHRLTSQRVDQHDAHMTALSALAAAEGSDRPDLFLDVAATIRRFYPRITAVDLVSLPPSRDYLTTRPGLSEEELATVRDVALASDGALALRAAPGRAGHYLLIKRSPNSDAARFGLALEVDGAALLATESDFWTRPSVTRALLMPDGTLLAGSGPISAPQFEKPLGSVSQPLLLQAGIAPALSDLLPGIRVAGLALLASAVYLVAALGLRQLARARRAERQARLSAQEARLAHASRINALGEMASGMAHELTQPLTAILSQAQAGRHLVERGDTRALAPVMQGIADQAKRASAIMERLRNWSRPNPDTERQSVVGEAVRNVELLLGPEAERNGVTLSADLDPLPLRVRGDPVELEQIIFNLVRNAIEATAGAPRSRVTMSSRRDGAFAVVEVSDSGPGVPAELRARLFEPFVTGRPGGTGLGLALCRRLAERMGGEIDLLAERPETVFRLRLPLAPAALQEAAE
ncbi:MAG TPA: ATP-binding protein [Amaricoccus sp.]|uniref:sensor histidine kinase n=1 Tax=Amaricoccus sp. TaxID=1872485 RepID=UPI001D23029D|nr:ATP-binding protein [Amaricoccus sp.]MCB1374276.1 two-component sensor histidine kinase [Paracoccaceae bacterium]MCC0068254.1 two-component sensor histidine kinase [Rhodovulum sp.]MCB1402995.1 two-component sensor histidine kinase [Paracoccaceae bacterium]HPG22056.1 ATP-binding protein [Amaricoccus sp.]HRW14698.1 ATP-binding protein [Amaricoccus sp.]